MKGPKGDFQVVGFYEPSAHSEKHSGQQKNAASTPCSPLALLYFFVAGSGSPKRRLLRPRNGPFGLSDWGLADAGWWLCASRRRSSAVPRWSEGSALPQEVTALASPTGHPRLVSQPSGFPRRNAMNCNKYGIASPWRGNKHFGMKRKPWLPIPGPANIDDGTADLTSNGMVSEMNVSFPNAGPMRRSREIRVHTPRKETLPASR